MPNVLESYLITLGFQTDQTAFRLFNVVLSNADSAVAEHADNMLGKIIKAQLGIVGAFVSIGAAALGMADKVAMADQSYQLMATRMLMTKDAARALTMTTDALGVSLEDIIWNKELHGRAVDIMGEISKFSEELGPNFEKNMVHLRDIRFEFSKLEIAAKFLGMSFVSSLIDKLGGGVAIQEKLSHWVDWLIQHVPELADKLSTALLPILQDTWMMLKAAGTAIEDFGIIFTDVVGILSGDGTIVATTFKFENFAKALDKCVYLMTQLLKLLPYIAGGAALGMAGGALFGGGLGALPLGIIGGVAGAGVGLTKHWLMDDDESPANDQAPADSAPTPRSDASPSPGRRQRQPARSVSGVGASGDVQSMIVAAANRYNIDPKLLLALAKQESGYKQSAVSGAGAVGVMQLMAGTADDMGVDRNDAYSNIDGGAHYLSNLLAKYHGNTDMALAAYDAGPGRVDSVAAYANKNNLDVNSYMANSGALPKETRDYVKSIHVNIEHVSIPAAAGNDPREHARILSEEVAKQMDNQVQFDNLQLQPA